MPHFRQIPEILKLMNRKESIRNIGIVAHIDHGKTTMTDSLLVEAGLLPPQIAGIARALDYLEEEQKRGITIKTANVSFLHLMDGESYVINLVDTPGHVDFTGKVSRALRAIDGVVVVVDAVEEVMAQTETVTRQALEESVKPVLFINKVDRLIGELKLSEEEIQNKFTRIINDFNNLVEIYGDPEFRNKWKANPLRDAVVFGSALHKWGFTVSKAKQKGIKFADIIDAYKNAKFQTIAKQLPLYDAVLDMVAKNIPNPLEAQKYRVPKIWRGNLNSDIGRAMLNCDDDGPLVICVTNVQIDPKGGAIATGRVFSGSVKNGDRVYLTGAAKECSVEQVSIYMGSFREAVAEVTSGNIVALKGIDLARAGETIVDVEHKDDMTAFGSMKYISTPVVTVAVEPKKPKDLPKLFDALNRLLVEDPNLKITIDNKSGEHLLSGMGELHLETAVSFLRKYAEGLELSTSAPTVSYRESVTSKGETVMAKSLNKQNTFWFQVEPLESDELESIRRDFEKNAWAEDENQNVLINYCQTRSLDEIKELIIAGFRWACNSGPLCEEPLRNVKAKLINAEIGENPESVEPEQVTRTVSRAIFGSFLTAKPVLLEPLYKIEISVPTQFMGECTNILAHRRGKIFATEQRNALTIIKGYIPVSETLGLTAKMRSATSGRAFWQCTFDRWEKMPEKLGLEVIEQIRRKRGLPPEIPKPEKFVE